MGRRKKPSAFDGILVVDKPRGPTSHDVVGRLRRVFETRTVGHAGTLDPMATGVLVAGVGEGTKLLRWLTSDDKTYRCTILLGHETDTLDTDGVETEALAPDHGGALELSRVRAAATEFVGTYPQRAPIYSAIKVDGTPLYERVRRGEVVEAPMRQVTVHRLDILAVREDAIELEVHSKKGFYVRSLGRDLARALGTRGHLTALRRVTSGAFTLEGAVTPEQLNAAAKAGPERESVRAALLGLPEACRGMARITVDELGAQDAHHGRAIRTERFVGPVPGANEDPVAVIGPARRLLAIGALVEGVLHVSRGIRQAPG